MTGRVNSGTPVTGVTAVPDGGRPRRTFPEAIPGRAPGAREAVRRAGRDAGQGVWRMGQDVSA